MSSISLNKNFFLCYFETTRNCNLNCPYCMSRTDSDTKHVNKPELSTDEIKHLVIDEVRKYTSNGAIAFSGGEHLMRPDALEIIKYNTKSGLWTFINTNGKLLTVPLLRKLKSITENRLIFVFPFNSVDLPVHQWSRDDELSTIIQASKLCEKEKVEYFYLVTISKNNLHVIDKTMHHLKMKQVPVLRAPFVPRGAGKSYPELIFSKDDMQNTIHQVLRNNYLSYISYTPFFASPDLLKNKWAELGISIGQLGCQAGKGFIGISAEGEVAPCVQLLDSKINCGNVRSIPLNQILTQDTILQKLRARDELKGKCGRCRYKHTCGGCRALAYYINNDILAEDPTCFFEPENETTKSEFETQQNVNVEQFIEFVKYNEPWNLLFG